MGRTGVVGEAGAVPEEHAVGQVGERDEVVKLALALDAEQIDELQPVGRVGGAVRLRHVLGHHVPVRLTNEI